MHKITWCKFILLATDFLTLFSSLFIAYEVLDIARGGRFYFPLEEFNTYVLIHACVSFVWCVVVLDTITALYLP